MKYVYEVNQEINSHIDIGNYSSYGLNVYVQVNGENKLLKRVSDLFTEEQDARAFAELCNSENLEPVHLDDVIEDIFSDRDMFT